MTKKKALALERSKCRFHGGARQRIHGLLPTSQVDVPASLAVYCGLLSKFWLLECE